MHRGIIGRVLVALGIVALGVVIIAKAPIGTGPKEAAQLNQGHAVVAYARASRAAHFER